VRILWHPADCPYCGQRKKLTLFARANRLRLACEFDKAANVYESIVAEFPEEAEAYWGLVLCRYGIEYVNDPVTGKKIPTCHRSSFDSILEDSDFEQTQENADTIARKVYRDEAKTIENLRRGILEVSSKEEPYDIFICYKENAEDGQRTLDSVLAQDVYDALTKKGYRVFFSRITLEDKLGTEYEPYIFAALNSSKVMLVFGTDYEYFNAVWVKNEWSRFLSLITKGQKKTLIPCYKDVDVYDMPKEFAKLQAQDMGKIGAIQDLVRGIDKIFNGSTVLTASPALIEWQLKVQEQAKADNTVQLGTMALNSGDMQKAVQYYEEAIKIDTNHVGAYIGLVRALDCEKSRPYCSRLEACSLEIVTEYMKCNPEMLVGQPVSLLDKTVSTLLPLGFIKILLDIGADSSNEYILYHAIVSKRTDKYDLIKLLLDNGISPNKEYILKFNNNVTEICTPLRDVIWQIKDPKLAELLIDYGADVNYSVKNNEGESWSLLDMAVRTNNVAMVQLLLERGADANSGRKHKGYYQFFGEKCTFYPALSDAICISKNVEIVTLLLDYNASLNTTYEICLDYERGHERAYSFPLADTILFLEDVEILQVLLDAGADLQMRYKYEYVQDGYGVDFDHGEYDISLLKLAERKGNKSAIQLLQWEQQKEEKAAKKGQLETEYTALQAELPSLEGLFAGIHRKKIESRISEIEAELKQMEV